MAKIFRKTDKQGNQYLEDDKGNVMSLPPDIEPQFFDLSNDTNYPVQGADQKSAPPSIKETNPFNGPDKAPIPEDVDLSKLKAPDKTVNINDKEEQVKLEKAIKDLNDKETVGLKSRESSPLLSTELAKKLAAAAMGAGTVGYVASEVPEIGTMGNLGENAAKLGSNLGGGVRQLGGNLIDFPGTASNLVYPLHVAGKTVQNLATGNKAQEFLNKGSRDYDFAANEKATEITSDKDLIPVYAEKDMIDTNGRPMIGEDNTPILKGDLIGYRKAPEKEAIRASEDLLDENGNVIVKKGDIVDYKPKEGEERLSLFGQKTISPEQAKMIGKEIGSVATGEGKIGKISDSLLGLLGSAVKGGAENVAGVIKPVRNLVGDVADAGGTVARAAVGDTLIDTIKNAITGKPSSSVGGQVAGGLIGLAKELAGQTAYGQYLIDPALRNLTGTSLYSQAATGTGSDPYLNALDTQANRIINKQIGQRTATEVKFLESYPENRKSYLEGLQNSQYKMDTGKLDPKSEQAKELTRWMAASKDIDDVASKIDFAIEHKDPSTMALLANKIAGISSVAIQQGVVSDEEARRVLGGVMSNFRTIAANGFQAPDVQRLLASPEWKSVKNMAATVNDGLKARMKTYKDVYSIPDQFFKSADINLAKPNVTLGGVETSIPKQEGSLQAEHVVAQNEIDKANFRANAIQKFVQGANTVEGYKQLGNSIFTQFGGKGKLFEDNESFSMNKVSEMIDNIYNEQEGINKPKEQKASAISNKPSAAPKNTGLSAEEQAQYDNLVGMGAGISEKGKAKLAELSKKRGK